LKLTSAKQNEETRSQEEIAYDLPVLAEMAGDTWS
jgi:hypothetical protein